MNEDFNPRDYPDGVEDDDYEVTGCGEDDAFADSMNGGWIPGEEPLDEDVFYTHDEDVVEF